MFYDWLRIIWYSLSKFVRWMKPEPLAVTVRQWVVFAVFSGSVFRADRYCLLYGGWVSFEHSEKEKLLLREEAAAEARAEHEDQDKEVARERAEQDKKSAQEREEREMKVAQERQEQQKQLAQIQKEFLVQVFATPTPPDPADVARYEAKANLWRHFVYAQRESQRYDKPPGSDDTVWEHQTYTDSNGIIWQRVTSADSDGAKRDYFVPQMPKEIH